jgi:Ca-activated chloride channel homolog
MAITFLDPVYLWLLFFLPLVYFFYYQTIKKKRKATLKFSSLGLIKEAVGEKKFSFRKHIIFVLTFLLILSLILALADPHIPLKQTKKGVNVVLVIDVSGSMSATDYKPNRVEAAKLSAKTLIQSLETKDKVGIVVFDSGATTASYLTAMKDRVLDKLSSIKAKQGQTAVGDGLALAVDMITSIPNKKKVIILLSDGATNAGVISPDEAVEFAKENEIQVYTIGMGSIGDTVLGYDWFGNPVYAEFDEDELKKIAQKTGGEYYKSVDELTLQEIYKGLSDKIKREKEDTSIKNWLVAFALIILAVMIYVQYGKYRIIQ